MGSLMKTKSILVSFYLGEGVDNRGRVFSDILNWDYVSIESVHDFIQWLFPLKVSSAYNGEAPILSQDDIDEFNKSNELRSNVIKALSLMLDFYGFCLESGHVIRSNHYRELASNWLSYGNHNMRRITRILKSLCLLGLNDYAQEFFHTLESVYKDNPDVIGDSYSYWKNALKRK